jgi:CBS domain-containing protein/sporulation protein YlmC with PRC-barrel domain
MKTPPVSTINTVAKKIVGRSDSALTKKSIRESLVSVSGLIGRPVRDESGRDIGRLVDIVVRNDDATYPPVSGLIVKVGQRKSYINGAKISSLTHSEIRISSLKINLEDFQRRDGESLLDADVLDHQIVDVDGLRVVRSSDLYLATLDKEVRLVGVDISFRSFVRRLFPGSLSRLPTPDHVVDWATIASLTSGTGVVRTAGHRSKLSQLRPADLADLLEDLAGREQGAFVDLLDPNLAADALEEMEEEDLQGLLRGLPAERAAELLALMEPDESAEVMRDLEIEHRDAILANMDKPTAKVLRELISFDEKVAGGMMTTHMLVIKQTDTVESAIKLLIEHKERDVVDGVLVVDSKGRLVDHIQTIELVAAKSSALIESLISAPFPTAVKIDTALDEVIEEFSNNRGSSIVVVDEKGKPIGRILADDLVDALTSDEGRA